jgi:hypothetical protein
MEPSMSVPRSIGAASAMAAFSAAIVYGTRLAPSIVLEGDSTEIVSAAAVWGVPHAPGYPLMTTIGFLFTLLPFGSIAWRVHLTSALFHVGAVYTTSLFTGRLTRSATAAAVAGLGLAFSRAFFAASLYAEVFPLNDLLFALLLLLAHDANEREPDEARKQGSRTHRALLKVACVFGLAMAHQPMILLGLPAILVIARDPLRSARLSLVLVTAIVPFLASYALLFTAAGRHPPISTGDVHDLASLVRVVLRLDYGGPFQASRSPPAELDVLARVGHGLVSLGRSASVLPALAAAGLVVWGRKRETSAVALALGLAVLVPGPVFAAMNAHFQRTDEEHAALAQRFTTMALVGLAPAAGIGADVIRTWVERRRPKLLSSTRAALIAAVVLSLAPGFYRIDFSKDRRGLAYARDLLRPAPDGAILFLEGDIAGAAALYSCEVEHLCGERVVLFPGLFSLPWYVAQIARRHPPLQALRVPDSVHRVHELVLPLLDHHAVFVMPGLLAKDPQLTEHMTATPTLLLVRLRRESDDKDATKDALEDTLLWAEAMAAPDARCAGCGIDATGLARPALEANLLAQYGAAMKNHAIYARAAGRSDLAERLERRSVMVSAGVSSVP